MVARAPYSPRTQQMVCVCLSGAGAAEEAGVWVRGFGVGFRGVWGRDDLEVERGQVGGGV